MSQRRTHARPDLVAFLASLVALANLAGIGSAQERALRLGESPLNNPLKGLVPYQAPIPDRFPHSMEFNTVGLANLVIGRDRYDWQPLESLLNDVASRGNQAVVRIYMEYPGKKDGIPQYLIAEGLKVHTYLNTNTQPFPPTEVSTPDYESEPLRAMLVQFIREFGKKYDGDPRLAYVTAGLLGTWGEWHTYPRNDLWASRRTQTEVMDAFEAAFQRTPVLLRNPAGENNPSYAMNANRRFGYHDDSLCWSTLDTGKPEDDWHFEPAMKSAGIDAINKWKTCPIGGEIRPEVWGKIFDDTIDIPQAQPFARCASVLHLTWTLDTGMFNEPASPQRLRNAMTEVRKLGYEFYVDKCSFPATVVAGQSVTVSVHLMNRGLAPMYHDWPVELSVADSKGVLAKTWRTNWKFALQLPDKAGKTYETEISTGELKPGQYQLMLQVVNPLRNGKPVQFANTDWAADLRDRLTLGTLTLH